MKHAIRLIPASFLLLAVAGCWQETPRSPEPEPEELLQDWLKLADVPVPDMDFGKAQLIGNRLAEAKRLDLILNVLGDAAANPKLKVLAVVSLTAMANTGIETRLLEFVAADREATTRACAAKLLGLVNSDTARDRLKTLIDDPEHRVRVTAILMLLRAGAPEALAKIPEIWASPETQISERTELVLSIPEAALSEFSPLLVEAAGNHDMDYESRRRAITALGRLGGAEAIPVLEAAVADDPIPALKELAQDSLSAVRDRMVYDTAEPGTGSASSVPNEVK